MKKDTTVAQFAKKLVELSKDNGVVTEAKITEILNALKQVPHRKPLALLKTFLSHIRREVALQTAVVSTPLTLSETNLKKIEEHFTEEYNRPIQAVQKNDASLIAGIKVKVGDDLFDASIAGHLQRLADNVH